jgi:hypothetical protein
MFGWTENSALRAAVRRGELVRVRVNTTRSGWRITAESALKRRQEKVELVEAGETFGYTPEQLRQFKMAKARQDESKLAINTPKDDEVRAEAQMAEAVRLMNENNERAAREKFAPTTNLDYWLKKVGYVPPVKNGTPEEINAAFIAEENAKPPIWVGPVAFHGIQHGMTAEVRAALYLNELKERSRPKRFSSQRGI